MKKLIITGLLLTSSFANQNFLTKTQKTILKEVKETAVELNLPQFKNSICAISLTETSAGKGGLIGDSYYQNGKVKPFIDKSLGINQVKLITAQMMIKHYKLKQYYYMLSKIGIYKKYTKYLFELKRFEAIHNNPIWKKRWAKGKGLRTKRWVENEVRHYQTKLKAYRKYYNKDFLLASTLLSDLKFNTIIALYYLKYNYEKAKKQGYKNPWRIAISRYNGGNHNIKYLNKIRKNLNICYQIK